MQRRSDVSADRPAEALRRTIKVYLICRRSDRERGEGMTIAAKVAARVLSD
jgi:hypothetical protein